MISPASDDRAGLPSMSGIERILNCPGSFHLSRGLSTPEKSWTRDGSLGHDALAGEADEDALTGEESVKWAVQRCLEISAEKRMELGFDGPEIIEVREERLWLHDAAGNPVCSGKMDLALIHVATKTALIFDWKLGRVAVAASAENAQLIGYALLLREEYGIESAHLQIVQPYAKRTPAGHANAESMVKWRAAMLEALEEARREDAVRSPGPWCNYCPARTICPEARDVASRVVIVAGGEAAPMRLEERWELLAPEARLDLFRWLKHAERTVKDALEFYKTQLAAAPDCVPGLRIKPGAEMVKIKGSLAVAEVLRGMGLTDEEILSCSAISLPSLASVKAGGRPGTTKLNAAGEAAKKEIREALGDLAEVKQKAGSIEAL